MLSERAEVGERAVSERALERVVKGSKVVMVALVMVKKVGVMVDKIYRTGVCMVV